MAEEEPMSPVDYVIVALKVRFVQENRHVGVRAEDWSEGCMQWGA